MTFLQQAGAAVLLVLITLTIRCGGAAALILWIRSIPRETRKVQVFHCAALVMQTTVAVIVLHGIVILLWASCYRWLCLPSWESAFYFSASSYATVGYGDVVLPSKWRLLGPLESMVGMLMSGVSIGLLFAAVTHLVDGRVTIPSTTSLRTRDCGSHRFPTKATLLLRSVALEGHTLKNSSP